MAPYTKPETVLKQAEGLVAVGQTHAALQSLTEMFASKRFRSTPLASLEPIMLRFIELSVELRKGRTAKEGLMQYKNIAQNTSVASIETVIKRFVQLADQKVAEAQEKANRAVALLDIDDLEASETPESILLGAVSGDQSRDRTDRALVTPWLKFLWESYRTALETLKNNARLEAIYQQIAMQAFKFCLKHVRKVEFRRLCETLRLHLANVAKYAHQAHSINLADPDTLQRHLDTRFAQLNAAAELELWQEAFRSVEDIHNLLTLAKKSPRPAMMANYYEKLARIFLTSGNLLFHAAAWARYFVIVRNTGGKTEEEMSALAGLVLLSALAVPIGAEDREAEEDAGKGRNSRLTSLLGLNKMPTRAGLLKDALSRNILKSSPLPIQTLYTLLETTFDPLSLCTLAAPPLQALAGTLEVGTSSPLTPPAESSYAPYVPLLHNVILARLVSQLSQVYSSVQISFVMELVTPLTASEVPESAEAFPNTSSSTKDPSAVEAFIMLSARRGELRVRLDHAAGTLDFSGDESPSSVLEGRVRSLAEALHASLVTIAPPANEMPGFEDVVAAAIEEREALTVRRALVARRRELLNELQTRQEREIAALKAEKSRREKEEEEKRVLEDIKKKERERMQREVESIRAAETRKLAEALKERGGVQIDMQDIDQLDTTKLLQLQVEQIDKEKRELTERLRIVSKRVDHWERALRREELPLLKKDFERQQEEDRKTHELRTKAALEAAKEHHAQELETKKRLLRMMDDYNAARSVFAGRRGEEYARRKEEARRKIEEEKAKRKKAVLKQRDEERKRKEEEERIRREEEDRLRQEEEERERAEQERIAAEAAARAEEERKAREKEEKIAAERAARLAEREKLEEQARKQREREEEAERRAAERAAQKQQERMSSSRPSPLGAARPVATANGEGGAWRSSRAAAPSPVEPPIRASGGYRPPGLRAGQEGSPSNTAPSSPALGGGAGGGWRARMAAKEAGPAPGSGRSTPEPAATPSPKVQDDDGFTPVVKASKGAWKPPHRR
ncbi:hypothetical protein AURDEDRAFT_115692 [Auricularia subglabra TFB-10046 SS5]|uniref:Eukaryotic translation initiation factor 3 subunit A n=1 Tax=Auricularia subglabra (strain TFB-10046 / SS5) TaxID=717982 RepID=J0D259_AURST|nr:hypothetical protein AURDEDRAFT_115692 [Auricularia subglabra TFB-10046 SS5]